MSLTRLSDGGQQCLFEAISSLCFILLKPARPDSLFPAFVAYPSARITQLPLLQYLLTEELPQVREAPDQFLAGFQSRFTRFLPHICQIGNQDSPLPNLLV